MDGFSFCGARSYELVDAASYASFLTLDDDNDTVALLSSLVSDEGLYTVKIRARLESMAISNPEIFKEATMQITIQPCQP